MKMKDKPVLTSAILLTLAIEIVLMILVYNEIGGKRLPIQIGRLIVQLIFIGLTYSKARSVGLYLLTGFHIFIGLIILVNQVHDGETLKMSFGIYHLAIGLIIYFHDWIEDAIPSKSTKK